MLPWFVAAALAQGLCDADGHVDFAVAAVARGDTGSARSALDRVETAVACGSPISQETLATWWIVDSAVLEILGDRGSAEGGYGSAKGLAPHVWPAALPTWLRSTYDAAPIPEGRGSLRLDPAPTAHSVWIDGVLRTSWEVSAGLHLVQVGQPQRDVVFARTVWVDPGVTSVVATQLDEAVIVPDRSPRSDPFEGPVAFGVLVGARAAAGDALYVPGFVPELGTKVSVPVEATVRASFAGAWARVSLGAGPLLRGRFLYQDVAGRLFTLPVHVDASLGAGAQLGPIHLGALAGMQWPSRIAVRGLVGLSPGGPWITEARVGVHLPTERRAEPMVELLVGLTTH